MFPLRQLEADWAFYSDTSGINKEFLSRELPLTGNVHFFTAFSVNTGDGYAFPKTLKTTCLAPTIMPTSKSHKSPFSCLV